ncbi:MAG: hypothetical protein FWD74_00990 [Actinomycetia bacterium]|nr:hypothetical protein [Actinomycetes bacterium]
MHRHVKEALTELRGIVCGIHPPALGVGLDVALATLAAHSAVPVTLRVDLGDRPDRASEAVAYFSVAEMLANIARHRPKPSRSTTSPSDSESTAPPSAARSMCSVLSLGSGRRSGALP